MVGLDLRGLFQPFPGYLLIPLVNCVLSICTVLSYLILQPNSHFFFQVGQLMKLGCGYCRSHPIPSPLRTH